MERSDVERFIQMLYTIRVNESSHHEELIDELKDFKELVAGICNEIRDLKAELVALGDILVALETPSQKDARAK